MYQKLEPYFHLLIYRILHPFSSLSLYLRAFSSAFHIRYHLKSQLHLLGELSVALFCSSIKIIDCNCKCAMIYANVCIIYSAETALSKENRQASGLEYEYYIFKIFRGYA